MISVVVRLFATMNSWCRERQRFRVKYNRPFQPLISGRNHVQVKRVKHEIRTPHQRQPPAEHGALDRSAVGGATARAPAGSVFVEQSTDHAQGRPGRTGYPHADGTAYAITRRICLDGHRRRRWPSAPGRQRAAGQSIGAAWFQAGLRGEYTGDPHEAVLLAKLLP